MPGTWGTSTELGGERILGAVPDAGERVLALIRAERDPEAGAELAAALGRLGHAPAIPDLVALLDDPRPPRPPAGDPGARRAARRRRRRHRRTRSVVRIISIAICFAAVVWPSPSPSSMAFLAVVRRGLGDRRGRASSSSPSRPCRPRSPRSSASSGVALTERAGRTLRPTPAGAAFAPYAADVLGLLEQGGARRARGRATAAAGRCASARSRPRASTSLPPLIQALSRAPPRPRDQPRRRQPRRRLPAPRRPRGRRRASPGSVPEDGRARRAARSPTTRVGADHRRPTTRWPSGAGSRWRSSRRGRGSSASPGRARAPCARTTSPSHGIRPTASSPSARTGRSSRRRGSGLGVALQSRAAVELEL